MNGVRRFGRGFSCQTERIDTEERADARVRVTEVAEAIRAAGMTAGNRVRRMDS